MKELLSGMIGESGANIVSFALIFVIIMIGIFIVYRIISRLGRNRIASNNRIRQPRLSVMDAAAVDNRRRLVLIRRDDVEHLLLIGGPTDVVVEQNIVLESRTPTRLQNSRIEPEYIERFRQHEAALASDMDEHPSLPLQTPPEKAATVELNSAIEPPVYHRPEEVKEAPVAVHKEAPKQVSPQQPQAAPASPNIPVAPEPAIANPNAHLHQRPRPAPKYTQQPRTILPAQPAPASQSSARLHPAYPLGQVSRGVVSSTSGVATATAAVAATAATAAPANPAPVHAPAATVKPVEPVMPPFHQGADNGHKGAHKEPELTPAVENEDLSGLDDALENVILAELESEITAHEQEAVAHDPEFSNDDFESQLLGSLDIPAVEKKKPADSIEDEMEKRLGALSRS